MKRTALYIIALSCLLLAGCQKDKPECGNAYFDGTIKYAVAVGEQVMTKAPGEEDSQVLALSNSEGTLSIPMIFNATEGISDVTSSPAALTRGTLVNTTGDDYKALSEFADIVSTFIAKAYDNAGDEKVSQTVTWSESKWTATPETYWEDTSLDFLAYANLPGLQDATITKDNVSTEHTVPASAADQTDILLGHYQGDGGETHTATIRFEHPLTAVRFIRGEMYESLIIKSIELNGVARTGTASMDAEGTITWSEVGTHDYTVSQEGDASTGLPVDGTTGLIGEPFIIIPQNLANENVMVSVTFTTGQIVEATLSAGQWRAGYTNTYTISTNLATTGIDVEDVVQNQVKRDLTITNTGTSPEYIRVALVGSWKDSSGKVVAAWNETQGTFVQFPGTNWILGSDGFYYYTKPVLGGNETANALFHQYIPNAAPVAGAHLELSVIGQAVIWDENKTQVSASWKSENGAPISSLSTTPEQ